ncbi:MAG: hypothetical protein WCD20_00245 [Rhodomicrobium sp.]
MPNSKRGIEVLGDPSLNKSTAFTEEEKQSLGIVGLVPDVTESEDLQLSRVMMQLGHKTTDLDRYIYLVNLLDHNETLFYRTVMSDPPGSCLLSTIQPSAKLASNSVTSTASRAACIFR